MFDQVDGPKFSGIKLNMAKERTLAVQEDLSIKIGRGYIVTSNLQFFYNIQTVMNSMQNNIFTDTISRFKSNTTAQELTLDFKNQIKLKIFKKSTLQPQQLIKKYWVLQRKYARIKTQDHRQEWQENERKLYLWFILAYSRLHFRKLSELTDKEWQEFSRCFGNKNILLMKYEGKSLEKNSQRVRWSHEEQQMLSSCVRSQLNGRWSEISKVLFFKSNGDCFKTAKQCRQHWLNHMDHQIKRGQWTVDQDLSILKYVMEEGHHWSKIVEALSSRRTEHMVKNRFGSLLSCGKKLMKLENQRISEKNLIEYLIEELTNNKEFVEIAKSKEEGEESLQSSSSQNLTVKKEENQNYYQGQKTDYQNDKQQIGVLKIEKEEENPQPEEPTDHQRVISPRPIRRQLQVSLTQQFTAPPFGHYLPSIGLSQPSCMTPHIPPYPMEGNILSYTSFNFLTGRESLHQVSSEGSLGGKPRMEPSSASTISKKIKCLKTCSLNSIETEQNNQE